MNDFRCRTTRTSRNQTGMKNQARPRYTTRFARAFPQFFSLSAYYANQGGFFEPEMLFPPVHFEPRMTPPSPLQIGRVRGLGLGLPCEALADSSGKAGPRPCRQAEHCTSVFAESHSRYVAFPAALRAEWTFSGVMGSVRILIPTASATAFATAAGIGMMPASDTPLAPKGPSGSSVSMK